MCIKNCDTNKDGVCDYNCDSNGDGKCDYNCDLDKDNVCDKNCDTNNDRICDNNCGSPIDISKDETHILTFKDLTNLENINIYPGWSSSKSFEITNTSSIDLVYTIKFTNVVNTFTTANNLHYGLIRDGETLIDIDKAQVPYSDGDMLKSVVIKPGETHTYLFKLTFKETGTNQDLDKGKNFSTKIQIENVH